MACYIGGAAVSAVYSKAYTPKKVCMLGYPLAYTEIDVKIDVQVMQLIPIDIN